MTCTADRYDFTGALGSEPTARHRGVATFGLFQRIRNAFFGWTGGVEDASSAAFMARSGGRLTDSLEREMFARRTISNWSVGE
jgi:hypothetical protein